MILPTRRPRRGFVLIWILVIVAIAATLTATAAPALRTINDAQRVRTTATMLREVANAVDSFNLVVKRGGPSFTTPYRLSQLVTPVLANDSLGCDSQLANNNLQGLWAANSPLVTIYMPDNGLWTPIGRLSDVPSASDAVQGQRRTSRNDPYYVQIPNVDVSLARMLDAYVDGTPDRQADTVTYTLPAADSTVLLSWNVFVPHLPAC